MDKLIKQYIDKGNIRMVLERQKEILEKLPKNSLWFRDLGSTGSFYQCGFCKQILIGEKYFDDHYKPIVQECPSCGTSFLENDELKITYVTLLLGREYEWEDLDAFEPYNFHYNIHHQMQLEQYGLTF